MPCTLAPIAITTGEPAGIGPEVALKAALALPATESIVLIGSRELLLETAQRLSLPEQWPSHITVHDVPLRAPVQPGKLDARNSAYVLDVLRHAAQGALAGTYSAVATAPVQKSVITLSGHDFSGHTEFFAELSGCKRVVMMLTSSAATDALRVALVTTHLPLRAVPDAITRQAVLETLRIVARDLAKSLGIARAKLAVTGLNPHAGESGHMGREEIDVIAPTIAQAQAEGIDATGPYPADTIFVAEHARHYDAIVCMYHDQGLPALKREGFGGGVNVTLGLPWVRTSVDHGTALDLAGRGTANIGSMLSALELARNMARARHGFPLD